LNLIEENLLLKYGWNDFFENNFNSFIGKIFLENNYKYFAGRILVVHKTNCRIISEFGEINGIISKKIIEDIENPISTEYPTVGDWVIFTYREIDKNAIIRGILPRQSRFSRNLFERKRKIEQAKEQVIAANIDLTFVVHALNKDFNISRVERYLASILDANSTPVILLNKADLCERVEDILSKVKKVCYPYPVYILCAIENKGIDNVIKHIKPGKTAIFLGSSGVGKSTIINKILGKEIIKVQELSDYKDRGKHTTSYREMYIVNNGGIVIDTPGLRGIQLWASKKKLEHIFSDIEELSRSCYFSNCSHSHEKNCAIKDAIEKGDLSQKRLENYYKIQKELSYIKRKDKKTKDRRKRVIYKRIKEY